MPIFEFKCMDCGEFVEILMMGKQDELDMKCKKCSSANLERILSTTNHAISGSGPASSGASTQSRTCSSGSCTTYTIPGPA